MIKVLIHLLKGPDATGVTMVIHSEITVCWQKPYGACNSKPPVFNYS